MKNYWKMKSFSLFSFYYAYVDHDLYLADQLFVQNKVKVKYRQKMEKEDSYYCIIFCKIPKIDEGAFIQVMEKLNNKMLLLGYRDYQEECDKIDKVISVTAKGRIRNEAICNN